MYPNEQNMIVVGQSQKEWRLLRQSSFISINEGTLIQRKMWKEKLFQTIVSILCISIRGIRLQCPIIKEWILLRGSYFVSADR